MGPSYHTFPGLGTSAAPPFFQAAAAYDGDRRKGRDKEDAVPYPVRVGRKPSPMKDQQGKAAGQQRDGHEGQPHDVQPVDGKGGPFRRQQPADPVRGRARRLDRQGAPYGRHRLARIPDAEGAAQADGDQRRGRYIENPARQRPAGALPVRGRFDPLEQIVRRHFKQVAQGDEPLQVRYALFAFPFGNGLP